MLGWLLPHRTRAAVLPAHELSALRQAILSSPYLAESDLNEGFTGTQGFSVMMRRDQLPRLGRILPAVLPYLERILDPTTYAFFLNPLVIREGAHVAPHADKTALSFTTPLEPPFPFRVSVLYLSIPPACQGGLLVFHRLFLRKRIQPVENLLVEFPGWLRHEVTRVSTREPRVSLVCEQYCLSSELLEKIPELFLDTTRPFQDFLENALDRESDDESEMESMKKIKIGVIFGGRSGEHEVSIMSARAVIDNLDREKYEVVPLAITREGNWLPPAGAQAALKAGVADTGTQGLVAICPGGENPLVPLEKAELPGVDLVFPVIHGTYGEDGTLQGLLEMAGLPYVGAGVSASAVGMDKALMKSVWAAHGLPQVNWTSVLRSRWEREPDKVLSELETAPGLPCFVKPANLGSSVGINKAKTREELRSAMNVAARFDRKIVIEQAIDKPREIEFSVLGNDFPEVSCPGEVVHGREFYDYRGKYFETDGQVTHIPAQVDPELTRRMQELAVRAYQALDINGLSRVDFMLDSANNIYLNEVNTMPGFTPISMYARMWEASGLPYPKLLDRLIELAWERFQDRERNACRPEEAEAVR